MMLSEQNIGEWAERFRKNELSPSEIETLEKILEGNENLKETWEEMLSLLILFEKRSKRAQMRTKVQNIALEQINKAAHSKQENQQKRKFISFKTFKIAGMAAALILFTALATLWITNTNQNHNNKNRYTFLRREIENIKHSQSKMMDSLSRQTMPIITDALYGGTGFALSNNGYLATNYHVVKGAHGIYVQTHKKVTYKAYLVAYDPNTDVAILKIEDSSFQFAATPPPYNLTDRTTGLGQKVFTLGYPQDDLVYNEGYISCEKGFNNDSASYQLEMVANPGQSGSPVLDNHGDIIALVTGKQSNTSGTTYAVHTDALLQLIHTLPDSVQSRIHLPHLHSIRHMTRINQVKKLQAYICAVKVN